MEKVPLCPRSRPKSSSKSHWLVSVSRTTRRRTRNKNTERCEGIGIPSKGEYRKTPTLHNIHSGPRLLFMRDTDVISEKHRARDYSQDPAARCVPGASRTISPPSIHPFVSFFFHFLLKKKKEKRKNDTRGSNRLDAQDTEGTSIN